MERYYDHISDIVSPVSRLSLLVGLKVTLQAMHPEINWRWLQDACNRLQTLVVAGRREYHDLPCIIALDRLARDEASPDRPQRLAFAMRFSWRCSFAAP
ncbi:hypothetical protein [Bosea rubneri]|uniref:Uncharacterized protein n=1 Tax=Bosea rubneri TaxID=3075434 RepID=A0ABU3SGM7_9HYPH|nr:hypothetical protein [Bosea sp. ZW T0_25]MDU0343938.1 hypothetical protein [Bosea sp. ZW T0_25]